MNCDSFVLSTRTHLMSVIIGDLQNLEDLFDFSNRNQTHELFSNKNRKVVGKFKIEFPKNIWIDEFISLWSKSFLFECNNKNTNILKVISKSRSKINKFEEYYNCLFGGDFEKECGFYVICSINHDMYIQKVCKSTLWAFDEKRNFLNEIESIPWN